MARLSVYLPPFAGDYSGACAALFGLDCLAVIVDASCCTRNYTEYDEPQWRGRRKSTFSAQLRTIDAVLGDDAQMVAQVERAVRELRPACVALVGTPVPAIVGMDLAGMARTVERACGVSAFGLATTGFETYERGAALAFETLAARFVRGTEAGAQPAAAAPGRRRANILGALPQDFADAQNLAAIEEWVRGQGFDLAWSTAGDYTLADVAAAGAADASLVVSTSGLGAARMLEQRFGVPYQVGCPACALEALAAGGALAAPDGDRVLIVHDQVIGNAMRAWLRGQGDGRQVHVASFFSMDPALQQPGDFALGCEADLVRYAEEHPALGVVGDPLLQRVPGIAPDRFAPLVHEAVSSNLFA